MTTKGLIFDIKRYAIHDGPGIRTTLFFKGCPLRCKWCHNPESYHLKEELFFRENRCIRCGACVSVCTSGAAQFRDGSVVYDRGHCTLCGKCTAVCFSGAREIVGREVTVEQALKEIDKDVIFFDDSGGGVTFSGGEPLMQPGFLDALLMGCREREIHTAVDTTCHAEPEVLERIREKVNLFLCDLKLMNDEAHRRFTGVSNKGILENLKKLAASGAAIVIRIPIIPGVNDDDENIGAMGDFVKSLKSVKQIDILPYNRGGREKQGRLGRDSELAGVSVPTKERMSAVEEKLRKFDFQVRVGG